MALLYAQQLEELEVEEMQETHASEIEILNEIDKLATYYGMDKSDTNLHALEEKIDAYLAHVKMHFANEEKLMRQYDFPKYEMHKTAHDIFLMDLDITIKQWKKFGNIEKVTNFIRSSPEWIVLHINTVDAPTSAYITEKRRE